ncbi:SUN domain-containing protein 1 [Diachasma alloeum]|uniref:SUN domain-containing protein 1 n=1 Tax=Diachasma alloeum TaxID=454923 RepID=UPI0007382985|nr:SUN domain-containing protein 1 [Diachasma alloeum]
MGITKTKKIVRSSSFDDFHDSSIESTVLDAQNPFVSILKLDLLVLLTVGYYFRRLVRVITPMLRIFTIVSFGITLVLTFLLIHSSLNHSSSRELAIAGQLQSTNYLLQQELERLRSKTLGLELAIRKMNSQLNAVRVDSKNHQETLADFASESAGGSIIDTPGTKSYHDQSQLQTLFGIPIWKPNYFTPRKVIQPWSQAGECWAFYGAQGKIEIELAYSTFVNRVTMEHIPASASLTGSIDSAPKEFRVLGKFRGKYIELGSFMYRDEGPPSQSFQIVREDMQNTPMKQIMLQILSNWGNPDYTCIYRFKVHGKMSNNLQDM